MHLVQPELCDLLQHLTFDASHQFSFRLDFFNIFELGARILLEKYWTFSTSEAQQPHIVIIGFGSLGQSLAIQTARSLYCHGASTAGRIRITVVDREADAKVCLLRLRYPCITEVSELIPCTADIEGPEFQRAEFLLDEHGRISARVIFVCFDNDTLGLLAALTLAIHTRKQNIPIVVRTTRYLHKLNS